MDAITPRQQVEADEHSHLVKPAEMEWKPTHFPGCEMKTLLFDGRTGLMTSLFRFVPGAILPDHEHVDIEQTYLLEGHLVDREGPATGIEARAGEFIWREPGSRHSAWSPNGGMTLASVQIPNKFFGADGRATDAAGQPWDKIWGHTESESQTAQEDTMDAITPKGGKITADEHSHVVKPAEMEWKPTRFPGCEVKTLMADPKTGLMTALMRFAPGAVLPDHEHVNIEQTYVLEGRLVDKEGPAEGIEAKKGEFIWREPGSRHSAWCPEGGLMLAIFQVPNKFHEKDGRVTDPTGKIWDEVWGHTGKG
jgi:anti-sigma factor ChrR (cupin superfamily)